jgi:Arc/MetJ-type ribon-helix-helix transcriptional regulator
MISVPTDIWNTIEKEVKSGKWQNMADGMRYYIRRGVEMNENR